MCSTLFESKYFIHCLLRLLALPTTLYTDAIMYLKHSLPTIQPPATNSRHVYENANKSFVYKNKLNY